MPGTPTEREPSGASRSFGDFAPALARLTNHN
jgi:hypothetical protein